MEYSPCHTISTCPTNITCHTMAAEQLRCIMSVNSRMLFTDKKIAVLKQPFEAFFEPFVRTSFLLRNQRFFLFRMNRVLLGPLITDKNGLSGGSPRKMGQGYTIPIQCEKKCFPYDAFDRSIR